MIVVACKDCTLPTILELTPFSALTLLVGHQEEHLTCKN